MDKKYSKYFHHYILINILMIGKMIAKNIPECQIEAAFGTKIS